MSGQNTTKNQGYPAYKSIKMINNPQAQQIAEPMKESNAQSQFGSRLSQHTNSSNNQNQKKLNQNIQNSQNQIPALPQHMGSPQKQIKMQNQLTPTPAGHFSAQARQSKNSSALGLIGGSIVSNT